MSAIRVGILRGGQSEHYYSSIEKSSHLISHIIENLYPKYVPYDIFVDTDGLWHMSGAPITPSDLLHRVDVVWNTGGNDLHNVLDNLALPNVSITSFPYALKSDRDLWKEHIKSAGFKIPRSVILPAYQMDFDGEIKSYAMKKAKEIFEKFGSPWIVRTVTPEKNIPMRVVKTFGELVYAIEELAKEQKSILIEEVITGKNISLHSVRGYRGEDFYTMPLLELNKNNDVVLSKIPNEDKTRLNNLMKELYHHLGAEHYLNLSLVLHPKGHIYVKNAEFLPDLREGSEFCKSCDLIGVKIQSVVEHMLKRALN